MWTPVLPKESSDRASSCDVLDRLLALAADLAIGSSAQPAAASQPHAAANGIVTPPAGAAVRGVVPVTGVAQSADFAKWQLDLLPAGDADRAVFLAVGETAARRQRAGQLRQHPLR